MVEHSNLKAFVRVRHAKLKSRINTLHAQRIEAKLARTYSDDIDTRAGALGLTAEHFRSSPRNDEIDCVRLSLAASR